MTRPTERIWSLNRRLLNNFDIEQILNQYMYNIQCNMTEQFRL